MASVWRDRDLGFLAGGELLAQVGSQVLFVVFPLLGLALTDDAGRAGLVVFAFGVPNGVLAILAGVLVDRVRAGRVLVASAAGQGVVLLALLALGVADALTLPMLLAGAFLAGTIAAPSRGAMGALVPRLVEARAARLRVTPAAADLENANALTTGVYRASLFIGPALGGVLVAAVGPVLPLGAAAGALLAGAVVLSGIREASREHARAAAASVAGAARAFTRDLADGVTYLVREPFLVRCAAFVLVLDAAFHAATGIALPAFAERVLADPRVLGFSLSAFGAGALAGAVFYRALGEGRMAGAWLPARIVPVSLVFAIPALTLHSYPLYAGMLVSGVLLQPLNIMLMARMQSRTPDALRGRVMSTFMSMSVLAMPASVLVAGFLVEAHGSRVVLAGVAGVTLAAGLAFVASGVVRRGVAEARA